MNKNFLETFTTPGLLQVLQSMGKVKLAQKIDKHAVYVAYTVLFSAFNL